MAAAQSSADNAWMLVSAALVLMMTGPGLALFYGGLVRRKNVLATMMHSFALMGWITVLWAVVRIQLVLWRKRAGSLADFGHLFLQGVGIDAEPGLRGNHSAADLHDLPVDVRDHHAGADLRRVRRSG